MSKMVDTQVEKSQCLINGVRNNLDALRQFGCTEEKMNAMEAELNKLKGFADELEELTRLTKAKRAEVNASLEKAKEQYKEVKLPIKNNMPNYEWHNYGIMDKQ